jgi:Methyltransferase small domain
MADEDAAVTSWLATLERTHLADMTSSEVARALRALSSCYVERRSKLASGDALGSRGKRAAFALFYGPLHFLVTREIVRALPSAAAGLSTILDVGCGTGAAGAAWALESRGRLIRGYDRHPWAIEEANATYGHFCLDGHAVRRDMTRTRLHADGQTGVLLAYAVNELTADGREHVRAELLSAHGSGARVLVIEPISRRATPWWEEWRRTIENAGGRADEWRFAVTLPSTQRALARAAGLSPRELTARSLWL